MARALISLVFWAVAIGPVAQDPRTPADDLPPLEGPVEILRGDLAPASEATLHEALRGPARPETTVRADVQPPPAVPERAGAGRPSPDAVWIGGYWAWDEPRREFAWASGVWRVPPRGETWVPGRWARDDRGWYRVPGSWSRRRDWRTEGPPVDRPEETAGPAPSPAYLFVPGTYAPDGDNLAWRPGRWIEGRPGQEWIPSGWVRRGSGWTFREGRWVGAAEDVAGIQTGGNGAAGARLPAGEPSSPAEPRGPAAISRDLLTRPAAFETSGVTATTASPILAPGERNAAAGPPSLVSDPPPPPGGSAVGGAPEAAQARTAPGAPAGASPVPTSTRMPAGPPPGYVMYPPGYVPPPGAPPPPGTARPGEDPNRRPGAQDPRRQAGPRNPLMRAILRPKRR